MVRVEGALPSFKTICLHLLSRRSAAAGAGGLVRVEGAFPSFKTICSHLLSRRSAAAGVGGWGDQAYSINTTRSHLLFPCKCTPPRPTTLRPPPLPPSPSQFTPTPPPPGRSGRRQSSDQIFSSPLPFTFPLHPSPSPVPFASPIRLVPVPLRHLVAVEEDVRLRFAQLLEVHRAPGGHGSGWVNAEVLTERERERCYVAGTCRPCRPGHASRAGTVGDRRGVS